MALEVQVRLFAGLASAAGTRELLWRGAPPATPADVWRELEEKYPAFARHRHHVKVAVNQNYASWDDVLASGDELAFLTPVSGGSDDGAGPADTAVTGAGRRCWVTAEPLSVDEVLRRVNRPEAGAIVLFAGVARRYTGDRVTEHLEYDAYVPMAVSEMEKIAAEVEAQWPGSRVAMVHRTGTVAIGEASVLIAVSAPHRAEAFPAARYAIDRLKERVPIWKKEVWAGGEMWVGEETDGAAASRG